MLMTLNAGLVCLTIHSLGGYDVKMDLNASHGQYKPVKFLIYFNI
jgi:uncharacterized membrane protein